MESPVQKADALIASLNHVLTVRTDLSTNTQKIINGSIVKAQEIHVDLSGIEKFVSLSYALNENALRKNLLIWNEFKTGNIRDKSVIQTLVENSKTLELLYQRGLDFTAIYKFSTDELKISLALGRICTRDVFFFEKLRSAWRDKGDKKFVTTRPHAITKGKEIFSALKQVRLVSEFSVVESTQPGKWESINEDRIRDLQRNNREAHLRFAFTPAPMDAITNELIQGGHWFEAYTYQIISEYLMRYKIDHEIYTRVSYKTFDVNFTEGDFDIIAMTEHKILLVECKSGVFRDDNSEIKKLIGKTKGLREVFDATGKKIEYEFVLVYNPKSIIPTKGLELLSSASIEVVKINEVRTFIDKKFQKK